MLNKLLQFIRRYELLKPGDHVCCAVSGGADSMALLFGLFLLRDKLEITLSAAHYNHGLRGTESDRDAAFVKDFCECYDIPLHLGCGQVTAGKKGLEAAARDARYSFFKTLPGKIATAHTADDNAETVLMHMVRGTGLKGLGGIAPIRGNVIRPMLMVTRKQVLSFLEEYHIRYVEDSTNQSDVFLRNRLRHHVIPLMKQENPKWSERISTMALGLRQDEQIISACVHDSALPTVSVLRQMDASRRGRHLADFLERNGVKEPERAHIALAESLVFSDKPSAKANFPGGVVICRNYDVLEVLSDGADLDSQELPCPGMVELGAAGIRIVCEPAKQAYRNKDDFTVSPQGKVMIRSRQLGDTIRLSGGTKTLKALFIDRKIPAEQRRWMPVIADEKGVLGVWEIGANLDRLSIDGQGIRIRFEKI